MKRIKFITNIKFFVSVKKCWVFVGILFCLSNSNLKQNSLATKQWFIMFKYLKELFWSQIWQGFKHYKRLPMTQRKREVSIHSRDLIKPIRFITNLTKALEGVLGQLVRTSFAGERKQTSLLVEWAKISGSYSAYRKSWHQQGRH